MKVLCLQPPSPPGMNVKRDYAGGMGVADPSTRQSYGHDPEYITLPYMSLLYTAGVLEQSGFETVFVDAQAEGLDAKAVEQKIMEENPQVLVSVVNLPSIAGDAELVRHLKQRFPSLTMILMGTVTTPLYRFVAHASEADFIVRGDPEVVLPGVLQELRSTGSLQAEGCIRQDGVLTNEEPGRVTDLDALPFLPYHLVPLPRYRYHGFGQGRPYAAVFASRGCSFRCYYCPYPTGFGGKVVHRDPVRVADEIENLVRRHGIRAILFRDQIFSLDRTKTARLCEEFIRRRLDIEWVVETRLDCVEESLLRKMKKAGCVRIHYGLESGDPKLFARVGKD
ncbi:MAG: B12-binding domain-containing radical SAM protein, partial [Kiritimatiellia bacterium]